MEDNKTIILREFEKLKGQFVITEGRDIERLVAVGEDDIDYYWVTYDGRKFKWHTCVGGLMPLKGYLRDEDYDKLVHIAKLNHYDQMTLWSNGKPESFIQYNIEHKNELMKLEGSTIDKLLTEVCWTLN